LFISVHVVTMDIVAQHAQSGSTTYITCVIQLNLNLNVADIKKSKSWVIL